MITVPFIYFSILLLFLYKRNGKKIDIACYIIGIYWISAFFGIFFDVFDLYTKDVQNYKISVDATIVYCGLITLCVSPFMLYPSTNIVSIRKIKNTKFLKRLSWITFFYFIIYLIISLPLLYKVLTGNIGEIREDHYAGFNDESTIITNLPFVLRLPFTFFNLFLGCPWILLFLGFYSLVIQKINFKYTILFFVASFLGIIQNIAQAGRSDTVYWLFSFGACYVFFLPLMSNNLKAKVKKIAFMLGALFLFYLLITTISRNVDSAEGTEGGIISYAGQSYINFCFFYDNFKCPLPSLQIIFPFLYHILGLSVGSIVDYQEALTMMTGYELGLFYTFLGQIAVTSSNQIMIIYCVFFVAISLIFIKQGHKKEFQIKYCYFYMVFSSVLFLGLFSHFYGLPSKTFSVVAFSFIFFRLKSVNNSALNTRQKKND